MRRVTLILLSLAASASLGCQCQRQTRQTGPACGEVQISNSPCGTACSSNSSRAGFGLFGTMFCDPRLSEGTAWGPWQYGYNLCLACSQLSNTVLGGDPDESLSSRFGRAQDDGVLPVRYGLAPATNLLVGPNHCRRCIEHDECREKELWAW